MVFRVVRYSQPHTWSEVGQFYSVRQEFGGMRVLQLKELFLPTEAIATWEVSEKTEVDWGVLKDSAKNHLLGLTSELISVIRQMNEYQDNYPINFLVGDGKYEHSYEWCIEQWLVKGFRFQGQKYNIRHTVEYLLLPVESKIEFLQPHQVFVFGSNTEGRHGKGAAKDAMKFGAVYGQAKGLQGQSYAIVTKDLAKGERSVSLPFIESQITELIQFAQQNPQLEFLVTKFGCSLAGYTVEEIGMLWGNKFVPANIILPTEFVKFVDTSREICQAQPVSTEVPVDKPVDQFVALHNHTDRSDGLGKVEDLVKAAVDAGHPAVAITDHGTMMGAIEFYDLCNKFNIKPILGNECYLEHPYSSLLSQKPLAEGLQGDYKPGARFHQIVLAKNLVGYKNLSKLTTWSELENKKSSGKGKAYPLITLEKLKEFSEGLIVTSGCIGSLVPQLIIFGELDLALQTMKEYQQIFGEDYYVELQDHDSQPIYRSLNKQLLAFAKQLGLKWVISPDTHYMKECHYETHRVFSCIKSDYNKTLRQAQESNFQYDKDLFFPTSDQLAERFNYLSVEDIEAGIASTLEIGEKVSTYDLFRPPTAPEFPLPAGVSAEEYLRQLTVDGLEEKFGYGRIPQEYSERIEYELGVINRMGFAGYFLVVADYIQWAKNQGIRVGTARGSAGGSLVAYGTGITNINPIFYNLSFERFLNPERASMPDIDTDFAVEDRDRVIQYVTQKYGKKRVSQICTYSRLTSKAAVRAVATVLEKPFSESLAVSDMIPVTRGKPEKLKKMIAEDSPSAEFRDRYQTDAEFKVWIDFACEIEDCIRGTGIHAAGILIADIDIEEYCPLMLTKDGQVATQYDMNWVERQGFLKMDFLGLNNLSIIEEAIQSIKRLREVYVDVDELPLDDPQTFAMFGRGETEGVFQFESAGMQDILRQLKPTSIDDLSVVNALYRPGALDAGMIPKYIARKHGKEEPEYIFDALKEVLGDTYGVLVYQEQIMKAAQVIAGQTPARADQLRKVVGKKLVDKMPKERADFVEGAVANGYEREKAELLFDQIETFGSYGFNRSHSAAYSLIAFQCAYLKTHYKAEFMAALLSKQGERDKVSKYLMVAKQQGVTVLPPDVNLSGLGFTPKDDQSILFGLRPIKHLGEAAINSILEARNESPFIDIIDFYTRTDVDTRGLTALIHCGAFDSLHNNRKQLIQSIQSMKKWMDDRKKATKEIPVLLEELKELESRFDEKGLAASIRRKEKSIESREQKLVVDYQLIEVDAEYSFDEKLRQEQESIGFFVSGNPVTSLEKKDLFPVYVPEETLDEEVSVDEPKFKKFITTSCAFIEKEFKVSKAGKQYMLCRLEDHAGTSIQGLVFERTLEQYQDELESALAITGKFVVNREDEGYKVILNEVLVF